MSDALDYPLGYSDNEARRLQNQAALIEDLLEYTLVRAGLSMGMRVLDLGCGVGDVSFLAGRMVGPTGSVLGVDRAAASLATARARAAESGIQNVAFEEATLESFETTETFDAIIGRFVLLYLREPAALLNRLSKYLRPGGIVAMQETDMTPASQFPPSELFATVIRWILGAYAAAGVERDMGAILLRTFLSAGLPRPDMLAMTPVSSGPDSPYYEFLTQLVRSMAPAIERAGLATLAEMDIATLTERLRHDAVSNERVLFPQRLVSAWTVWPGR
jgi:SAM-dependent methyltransferase